MYDTYSLNVFACPVFLPDLTYKKRKGNYAARMVVDI